jgi:nanoRNase/pAp phosphatase (c-di-AMP/oligoRNAs hydrolase)
VIIDHHPETDVKAGFIDIRPTYGATATILTEYLRAARIKPSVKLATGLFYAIKNDTQNFARKTIIEDVLAFQFLFRYANPHLVNKIEQAEMRLDFLKYYKKAIENMRIRKKRTFTHLGAISSPDVLVLIADFFMKIHSIKWSIVSGIHANNLIIIFRNDGIRKHAGKVASQSFGPYGSAGGHKSMARAEIEINDLKGIVARNSTKKMAQWIIDMVEKKAETKQKKTQGKN